MHITQSPTRKFTYLFAQFLLQISKSTFWHYDYLEEKITCKTIPLYYIINRKAAKFLIKSYQVHSSINFLRILTQSKVYKALARFLSICRSMLYIKGLTLFIYLLQCLLSKISETFTRTDSYYQFHSYRKKKRKESHSPDQNF